MPFPESQRVVFTKNPLTQVVAQLQFPPILAIVAGDPAAFQERIRASYPLYSRQPLVEFPEEIAGVMRGLNLPFQTQLVRHVFSTPNQSRAASLTRDFLALEDREYRRWEDFREQLEMLQRALEDTYQPAFYTRIGLRYVDVIDPQKVGIEKSSDWTALINPTLLGLLGDPNLRDDVEESTSVTTLSVAEVPGGMVRLQHGLRPGERGTPCYMIDVDLFTHTQAGPGHVIHYLNIFNRIAGNLFRWSISEALSSALEPVPLDFRGVAASGNR